MSGEAGQAAALGVLSARARDALRAVLAGVDGDGVRDALLESLPAIGERFGFAAAALAAEWYESVREEAGVPGRFDVVLADLPSSQRYESLAAWATQMRDVEAAAAGGLQRIIANAHRDTVAVSAVADPAARGWGRFAHGETCDFCLMLTSRGDVYTDRTAVFASHDWCDCGAGPIWKGDTTIESRYRSSARRRS